MQLIVCLFQGVAVHLAGQHQDLPPDQPVDQVAVLRRDKEVNRLVDTGQRSRWMVHISFCFIFPSPFFERVLKDV